MYRRRTPTANALTIFLDDRPVPAVEGESVAAALLAAGLDRGRDSAVSASPRAPYCMMGICFECLMEIDGVANRQTCMIRVRDGMRIRRQAQAARLAP